MCGIYAVQGKKASERVIGGLQRLEYRGYDSWGVAALVNKSFTTQKSTSPLSEAVDKAAPDTVMAIGHTRWATHGGVTENNAHPHIAPGGKFALVQNGVVENYQELKRSLIKEGYKFLSETDTEVIVGLLSREMNRKGEDKVSLEAVLDTFSLLEGRNTIGVLSAEGGLLAVRDGSPLIVARNAGGEYFLASDTLSVAVDGDEYCVVDSREAVVIYDDSAEIINVDTRERRPARFKKLDMEASAVDHNGYNSFMMKEIHEQGEVLSGIFRNSLEQYQELAGVIKKSEKVLILGAGSAHFASGQIAYYLRKAGIDAQAVPAYEAASYKELLGKNSLAIAISQSGETADTIEVIECMKEKGVKIASIVNMAGSTIEQLSDYPFKLGAGPEIAVASTKAFIAQTVWGWLVSQYFIGKDINDLEAKVKEIEQKISSWLNDKKVQEITRKLSRQMNEGEHCFILGRGQLYYAALEGALKLKEISYVHAEGFSGGELKHGVIALIEKGTPVFVVIANDSEKAAMLNAAAEVSARGGKVIGVAPENNELFAEWLPVIDDEEFAMQASVLPFQLLTCMIAENSGRNPDKPRNLAKSVTVK